MTLLKEDALEFYLDKSVTDGSYAIAAALLIVGKAGIEQVLPGVIISDTSVKLVDQIVLDLVEETGGTTFEVNELLATVNSRLPADHYALGNSELGRILRKCPSFTTIKRNPRAGGKGRRRLVTFSLKEADELLA